MFPGEQYQAPRSWTERAYPRLIYYSRAENGGQFAAWQFAAWEQPQIFAQELRAASRTGLAALAPTVPTRRLQDGQQPNAH